MPMKIPLRKTDISPADWRVEKYVFWERNKKINRRSELRYCSYLDKAVEMYRQMTQFATPGSDILKIFLSESIDNNSNRDRIYLFKKKMIGKRLNKIMSRCQLNWHIIDCV